MRPFVSMSLLLLVPALIPGCTGSEPPQTPDRTVLRVGTDATYPPFETVNVATGRPEGFDIDLIKAVCEVNGWSPEFTVTPFDGIILGLNNNKYDVVISAMTITPSRAAAVAFSDPYYLAGQTVAVPVDDSTTSGLDDLRGKRVGVQLGTTGELMAKRTDGLQVYSYDNIGAAFIDMANGNLDGVLNDYPTTQAYIRAHGTARTVGDILSQEQYGIAARKADTLLLAAVNRALLTIRADGRYDSLHVRWFGVPPRVVPTDSTSSARGTNP